MTKNAVFALLLLSCSPLCAQQSGHETPRVSGRETLRGLPQVRVLIENLDDDELKAGITKDQLRADTELRLRRARIKVVDDDKSYLYVRVTAIADADKWSFVVAVTMNQPAELTRTNRPFIAETWGTGGLWTADSSEFLSAVRQAVGDSVDKFISDYIAANQK